MRAALVLCLCVLLAACGPSLTSTVASAPRTSEGSASATRTSGPQISDPPVVAVAPGNNLPAFACADAGGGKTGVANVQVARVNEPRVSAFDRFVLQFDAAVPSYTVTRQASPVFPFGPSGQTITLSGTAGVLVRVHSATGANTFTGSTDLTHPEYPILKEARQTEDFEGYVSWGLGLSKAACMRAFTTTGPGRLVVDFTTATG
jgi:hypothetical protein